MHVFHFRSVFIGVLLRVFANDCCLIKHNISYLLILDTVFRVCLYSLVGAD